MARMTIRDSTRIAALFAFGSMSGVAFGGAAGYTVFPELVGAVMGGFVGLIAGALSLFFVVPLLRHTRLAISLPIVFAGTMFAGVLASQLILGAAVVALMAEMALCTVAWRWLQDPDCVPHRGRCTSCGYDITGLTRSICPECGADLPPTPPDR